jgi:excisionase family DNA binding protein
MVTHPLGTEMDAVQHVAESLGLRTKTIHEALEAGKLKATKTGAQCLMTREAVREYVDRVPEGRRPTETRRAETASAPGYARPTALTRLSGREKAHREQGLMG